MSFSKKVNDLMLACLINKPEFDANDPDAVVVEGLTAKFVFSREALETARGEYLQLAQEHLDDKFKKSIGEGYSFLGLPFNKRGEQVCEHPTAQGFLVLGLGMGVAEYCLPKELWVVLPGGVPYVAFDIQ